MSLAKRVVCGAVASAALAASSPAFAATPAGCYFGVWKVNEQLSKRTRPVRGPVMIFIAPWGDNGWVRVNTNDEGARQNSEFHFATWDAKVYPVYGDDPRETSARKTGDLALENMSIRGGVPGDKSVIVFTNDCKRMTSTTPAGVRRDTGLRYENDVRIYDKLEPAGGGVAASAATANLFGAWRLNPQASTMTRPPMDDETVLLVPYGQTGLAQIAVHSAYQPDDFKKGIKPTPEQVRTRREMFFATWDGKPYPTYGFDPQQVMLKRLDDMHFEATLIRLHQPWDEGSRMTIAFSPDGKRMVQTISGTTETGAVYQNDVRVFDRIELSDWPGEARALE
jgi:hypothetical protein